MTYFLDDSARLPDPFVKPAPRPLTSAGERFRASRTENDILADRGSALVPGEGDIGQRKRELLRQIADRLPVEDDEPIRLNPSLGEMTPEQMQALRKRRAMNRAMNDVDGTLGKAAASAQSDPNAWADLPVTKEALAARITADRRAALDDAREVLDYGPGDAFGVEMLGAMQSDFATEENAVALALSPFIPGGAVARIMGEGVLNAGVEVAEVPTRNRVAEELGEQEVNPLERAAIGFAFGAGFQGVIEGGARVLRGAKDPSARAKTYQAWRNRLPQRFRGDAAEGTAALREAEEAALAGDATRAPITAVNDGMPDRDALIAAVIKQESGGDPNAVSSAGAVGMMQLMPATARDPGFGINNIFDTARSLGRTVDDETDETLNVLLRDPEVNQAIGTAYLDAMEKRYPGDLQAMLVAYNAGPGVADKWVANGRSRLSLPAETRNYITRVRGFLDRPTQRKAVTQGGDTLTTSTGSSHPFEYRVVELDSLNASHINGQVNPSFPPELQPRDRSRGASETQIEDIAANLNPRLLGRSVFASDGAPVTGADGVVEAGNGRIEALRRVYEANPDNADAYRAFLQQDGFDVEGFARPVLVRTRLDAGDVTERASFAKSANDRTTAEPSLTERAQTDARALPDSALELYQGGAISSAANRSFVRAAISTIPPSERGALFTRGNTLSAAGAKRVEQVLLARAYDDARVLDLVLEAPDELSRVVVGAMQDVAPSAAQLRGDVQRGDLGADFDIGGSIAEAALRVRQARSNGDSVQDALDQLDLLNAAPDGLDESLTRMMFSDDSMTRLASREKIGERLGLLIQRLRGEAGGPGLFGDDLRLSAGEIAADVARESGLTPPAARPRPEPKNSNLKQTYSSKKFVVDQNADVAIADIDANLIVSANTPKEIQAFSEKLIADFNINKKLMISTADDLSEFGIRGVKHEYPEIQNNPRLSDTRGFLSHRFTQSHDAYLIVVNPKSRGNRKSKISDMEVVAHEFGHIIENEMLSSNTLLRKKLESAAASAEIKSPSDVIARRSPPMTGRADEIDFRKEHGSNADNLLKNGKVDFYQKSFDEWFADQVSRHLILEPATNDIIESFFSNIAKIWKKIASKLRAEPGYLNAEVTEFLDSIRNRKSANINTPTAQDEIRNSLSSQPEPSAANANPPRQPPPAGDTPKDVVRAMQIEQDIRDRIAADPNFAALEDPETGMTAAQTLEFLERDADFDAVLSACNVGGSR